MPKAPLDFTKVEAFRAQMMLTMDNMARLSGVSRVTYFGWTRGKPLRPKNDERVRRMLRELYAVMSNGWPEPRVIAMSPKQRFETLLEQLPKQE